MYHIGEELDSVLAFQAFVGQRRHGHFDHDSHGVTGTSPLRQQKQTIISKRDVDAPSGSVRVRVKIKIDEETGAYLRG